MASSHLADVTKVRFIYKWFDDSESDHVLFGGGEVDANLHTPNNFWTTDDTDLKFYMVIDIHKLFKKIEKKLGWKC